MEPKILSETPVSMAELKAEMAKIKKREEEPSIRIQRMDDYLNSFSLLSPAKNKELVEALEKLEIPRLKIEHIIKISDLRPKTVEELEVILQGYTISVTKESMKKIIDEVAKFL